MLVYDINMHGNFKGNKAKFVAKHMWLRKYYPPPKKCNRCGKETDKLELSSNNGHIYTRNIKDYEYICRSCHITKDELFKNFIRKGESNSSAKLKEKDVLKIRKLYKIGNYTQQQLANIFNIRQQNISKIINRLKWKHI